MTVELFSDMQWVGLFLESYMTTTPYNYEKKKKTKANCYTEYFSIQKIYEYHENNFPFRKLEGGGLQKHGLLAHLRG